MNPANAPYVIIGKDRAGYFIGGDSTMSMDDVITRVHQVVDCKAAVFVYVHNKQRYLAIDVEPDKNWNTESMATHQVIGVFPPQQFDELIQTYAPFL